MDQPGPTQATHGKHQAFGVELLGGAGPGWPSVGDTKRPTNPSAEGTYSAEIDVEIETNRLVPVATYITKDIMLYCAGCRLSNQ